MSYETWIKEFTETQPLEPSLKDAYIQGKRDNQMNKELNEFATGVQSSFFSTRETMQEAFKYAYDVINAMPKGAQAPAYTALHVVVNTLAEEVKRLTLLGTNRGDSDE